MTLGELMDIIDKRIKEHADEILQGQEDKDADEEDSEE